MTDSIKVLENEEAPDLFMLTRCYLVLGEAEENLQKYKRAIKYYQKGLRYYKETEEMYDDSYMLTYLTFKIGMLFLVLIVKEEAINFLHMIYAIAVYHHL